MKRVVIFLLMLAPLWAQDWPEWRGRGRTGVWRESGILERFPEGGLEVTWRIPIGAGFAGPAVADGRVYVTDFVADPESRTLDGTERLHCLDEKTGRILWTNRWPVTYRSLMVSYATGPRATPTVDGERVYAVGAMGNLRAVDAGTGRLIWEKDYVRDYATSVPTWGITGAPLVDGDRLIAIVGGEPDAEVVAFDKRTGGEIWRAIEVTSEPGYGQPVIYEAGGVRQLIVWHPGGLSSVDPETGAVYWEEPWEAPMGLTVATPVKSGHYLFVSQFYGGSMMMELSSSRPRARPLWKIKGSSERPDGTAALHALITTPVIEGDFIYGVCSYGQLRCLNARTGERLWESVEMIELARWAAALMVRNGDRYFVNNDQGDLIIARFSPGGYEEIDRTRLIEPTSNSSWGSRPGRRKRGERVVNWSHPAYANGHIVARNDNQILRASLQRRGRTR